MEYLDCPSIRIYINDASKEMFYELEDLRDIRDRSVLRIYEHGVNGPQPVGGQNLPIPSSEQFGYFSEPEFESKYQSQNTHRNRGVPNQQPLPTTSGQSQYYGTIILPAQYRMSSQTMSTQAYGSGQPPNRIKPFPGKHKSFNCLTLFLNWLPSDCFIEGYTQTLPRNSNIASLYGNTYSSGSSANTNQQPNPSPVETQTQRSVSPDLISKQRPKVQIG